MTNHNRTCNIEDFADPAIRAVIRDVFGHELALFPAEYPDGVADSKQWEIAMAVRALREFGALRPDARLLGVGAGTEATTFYLSRHARQVVATDIYAGAGPWADVAPSGFLVAPDAYAGDIPCDPRRILPLHQDARALDLPDDEFDGVFSSGSIEHFGSLPFVANAAYEIGRVLKPGGIAAIATEFKVAGPPDGDGWDPNVILFSPEKLQRWIVEASGLEPVDALETELSDATLSVRRDLLAFLNATKQVTHPAQKIGVYPNLILYHEGYLFCSVALTLRKPAQGWGARNGWAAPDAATRALAAEGKRAAVQALSAPAEGGMAAFFGLTPPPPPEPPPPPPVVVDPETEQRALHAEAQLAAAEQRAQDAEARLAAADQRAAGAEAEVAALRSSTSWKLTGPFRRLVRLLR
jgi:SAM-dependent methyltransferase